MAKYTFEIKTLSTKKQHKIFKYRTSNLRIFNKTSIIKLQQKKIYIYMYKKYIITSLK